MGRNVFSWIGARIKWAIKAMHELFSWFQPLVSVVASVAIIFGIYFAYKQLQLSTTLEKRRTAIEAVYQVRTPDFQNALADLKRANNSKKGKIVLDNPMIDRVNHVMNVYDHLAMLYIDDLADRCILKESTYSTIKEMSEINDAIEYPGDSTESQAHYRKRFVEVLDLISSQPGRHVRRGGDISRQRQCESLTRSITDYGVGDATHSARRYLHRVWPSCRVLTIGLGGRDVKVDVYL